MKVFKQIADLWRSLFRKRRLSITNVSNANEEWHMHLSPAGMIAGSVSFLILLFILILSLVAYSPVLEMLPGFRSEADRSRENLLQNIIRLDSMERVMAQMMTYNENIAMIMEGKSPVARTVQHSDSTRQSKILVVPSAEDSLLRAQMEGEGAYNLQHDAARRAVRESIELIAPVEGIITDHFSIEEGRFGISIAANNTDRVTAIDEGTVIASVWSPDLGQQLMIQHRNRLVAIYKGLAEPVVAVGQTVRAGELVGHLAAEQSNTEEEKPFMLELWSEGKPLDPEAYIVF
ncbi:MAG: M23 family metallopeptidase [Alistipes sp.]|nr:M23 family metallopeptidase [Alistipes sp.]